MPLPTSLTPISIVADPTNTELTPLDPTATLFTFVADKQGEVAGSGNYPTFLRIGADTVEEGFNTDNPAGTLNDKSSAHLTHSLLLSQLQPITGPDGSTQYYEFRLDLNQSGAGPNIVLDELKVYTSNNAANLIDFNPGVDTLGNNNGDGTTFNLAYDLGSNAILLQSHNSGLGHDDYIIDIPVSDFAAGVAAGDQYVTLFAKFGGLTGYDSGAGFEQFQAVTQSGGSSTGGQGTFLIQKDYSLVGPGVDNITDSGAVTAAGQTIYYTIQVFNDGQDALTLKQITDSIQGPGSQNQLSGPTSSDGNTTTLDVGATWVFTETHVVTQQEIDDNGNNTSVPDPTVTTTPTNPGFIDNIATATFMDGSVQIGPESSETMTPIVQNPAVSITKVAATTPEGGFPYDSNTGDQPDAGQIDHNGQTVTYTIEVTNSGNETLTNVVVTDPMDPNGTDPGNADNVVGTIASLAPNGVQDFTYTITATQAQIDSGANIVNTATVTDDQNITQQATATVQIDQDPSLSITKVAATTPNDSNDTGQVDHAGQTVTYTIEVTNTGNETLTNVQVVDPMDPLGSDPGNADNLVGTIASLAVGAHQDFTYTITATQTQIDNGASIVNTATATDNQGDNQSATATVPIDQDPGLSITKVAATTPEGGWPDDATDASDANQVDHAGQEIDYTIKVTNTGNETLTNVQVVDPNDPNVITAVTLGVGDSETIKYSTFATQAQIDSGAPIPNTATVTDNQGDNQQASATVNIDQDPSLSITKVAATTPEGGWPDDATDASDANQVDHAGQEIDYTIVVTNTGNMDLTNVQVVDPNDPNVITAVTLGVGDSETIKYSTFATQAQIDSGAPILNTATVTDNQGDNQQASATVNIDQDPSLSITKVAATTPTDPADKGQVDHSGQTITYTITVTNTGNMDLTNVQVVDPNDPFGSDPGKADNVVGTLASLAVGASQQFQYTITATQAEIDSGASIVNTATVTDNQGDNQSATATVPIDQDPAVNVEKLVSVDGGHNWYFLQASGDSYDTVTFISGASGIASGNLHIGTPTTPIGGSVQYEFVVSNIGNVDLTDVSLSDPTLSFSDDTKAGLNVGKSEVIAGPPPGVAGIGTQTNTVTVTGTTTTAGSVNDTDSAAYTGIFVPGTAGLTIGYWYNHHTVSETTGTKFVTGAWHEAYLTYTDPGTGKSTTIEGVLLGDGGGTVWQAHNTLGSALTTTSFTSGHDAYGMLFIPDAAAIELINSSQSANDTRQILLSQALATQLNIDNGDKDPGYTGPGSTQNLISEAVQWLEGNPIAGGKIDTNGDGILSAGVPGKTQPATTYEFNTSTGAFTSPNPTSSGAAWQTQEAIYRAADYAPSGSTSIFSQSPTNTPFSADGEGLKNALQAFNQNLLVTSANGSAVAWDASGSTSGPFTDVSLNGANDFWNILHIQVNAGSSASLHGIL